MDGREILLGVSGGIAAYKSADLASKLVQQGASLSVVMTHSAKKFVGPATFAALTGRRVHVDLFDVQEHATGAHIGLARRAEFMIVAPASANFLAKAAGGLADDLLSTLVLSFTGPILLAPAMNTQMWNKPAVQRNVQQLQEDGFHFVEPGTGWLSCREVGAGRMAEPAEILDALARLVDQ